MANLPKVFLDSSVLFSLVYSDKGAAWAIFNLGKENKIKVIVSRYVTEEVTEVLWEKLPEAINLYLRLISQIQIIKRSNRVQVKKFINLIEDKNDAPILADATYEKANYLITLDKKHFIKNKKLSKVVKFQIITPGEFMKLYREGKI